MKCNFKNKFLNERKNRDNLISAFQKTFIDGDFKDLITPEALAQSLRLLLAEVTNELD